MKTFLIVATLFVVGSLICMVMLVPETPLYNTDRDKMFTGKPDSVVMVDLSLYKRYDLFFDSVVVSYYPRDDKFICSTKYGNIPIDWVAPENKVSDATLERLRGYCR
jgi:hypothetical protein